MIFARRSPRGTDPHLEGKVQLFFGGAAVALLGIALESKVLVGLALLVLIGGVFFHLFLGRSATGDEEDRPEEGSYEESGQE